MRYHTAPTAEELARWIVEHGVHKRPEVERETGIPLYLPVPELPRERPERKTEISYEIEF